MTDLAAHRDQVLAYFRSRSTVAAVVARRQLGAPQADDAELADHLIRQRRRRSSLDGSIDHALVPTARALAELLYLGAPHDHSSVVRLSGYLIGRQDQPGRWGEEDGRGTGFFSPGPIDQPAAPLTLHSGLVVTGEADARFAGSCIALRQVLRARHEGRAAVRTHVDALLDLGPDAVGPVLAAPALAALAAAAPDQRARAQGWVAAIADASDLPVAHVFAALVPVPDATARAVVRDRLLAQPPLPDDAPETEAFIYARAVATAQLAP